MIKSIAMGGLSMLAAVVSLRENDKVALTIYNQNFGVVRQTRAVEIPAGVSTVRFTDVAAQIDGTSVYLQSLTDPATTVLEQNFEYDLVSADRLLQRYIDQQLTVLTKDGTRYSGKLLSFDERQLVLRLEGAGDGIVMIERGDNVKDIQFGALPGGLITKPTLVWKVATTKPGRHRVEVAYQTAGLNWHADYNAVLSATDTAVDLSGWVTIYNQSGATYENASLKLIAGDVRRVPSPLPPAMRGRAVVAFAEAAPQFQEKSFFEYHLYTLQRPTTVANNQTKQIELLKAVGVPVKKTFLYCGVPQYRFYGGLNTDPGFGSEDSNRKVNVIVELKNSKENQMGMPLPKGRVRVFKRDDADGTLEFVGEDQIDHTPKDETLRLYVGDAFDVVGERRRTDFKIDTGNKTISESFEICIRNHKTEPVEVLVKEPLYRWSNWQIMAKSHDWIKHDANTIHFPVRVGKNGEQIITYTVRYTW